MDRNAGFTLIELMIVVAIIGILASIGLPSYSDYLVRSQVTEGMVIVDAMKGHVKDFHEEHGRFPATNEEAGIPLPQQLIGHYVEKVILEEGAFHIHYGNKANQAIRDQVLTLRPMVVVGSPFSPYAWLCGHDETVPGMLPLGENRTTLMREALPASCR